jgi:lipopolysaccharide transport protein LptA
MAHSCRKLLLLLGCACVCSASAAPPGAATSSKALLPGVGTQPITLDAASTQVDLTSRTTLFSNITITQGTLKLQADHARATDPGDFSNTRWTFEGHVRMDAEQQGSLRSDDAVVEFKANHIARATVTGKPAEFEQKRSDSQAVAHGHADEIVYDVNNGTVRLSKDAWLSDGQNEISGPLLVYDIRAQRIQAATSPGSDQRVHIIIQPQSVPKPAQNPQP